MYKILLQEIKTPVTAAAAVRVGTRLWRRPPGWQTTRATRSYCSSSPPPQRNWDQAAPPLDPRVALRARSRPRSPALPRRACPHPPIKASYTGQEEEPRLSWAPPTTRRRCRRNTKSSTNSSRTETRRTRWPRSPPRPQGRPRSVRTLEEEEEETQEENQSRSRTVPKKRNPTPCCTTCSTTTRTKSRSPETSNLRNWRGKEEVPLHSAGGRQTIWIKSRSSLKLLMR